MTKKKKKHMNIIKAYKNEQFLKKKYAKRT